MADEEILCDAKSLREPFRTLISAAILAPSGDNTQPWRFEIDEDGASVTVCVDESRDTSPMNAGQRMARIACGAAIENMIRTADYNSWQVEFIQHCSHNRLATVRVANEIREAGIIEQAIQDRQTNRRPFDKSLSPKLDILAICNSIRPVRGTYLLFVLGETKLHDSSKVIGQVDAEMLGQPHFLRSFLKNVRFDLLWGKEANEGLTIDSLELSLVERWVLPYLASLPDRIIRSAMMRRGFYKKACQAVANSLGLCIILRRQGDLTSDVDVGRTMQRAWLEFTKCGLSVQPMMSLPVLESAITFGDVIGCQHAVDNVMRYSRQLSNIADVCNDRSIAAILRFGVAQSPQGRTRRRAIDDVTSEALSATKHC